MARQVIQRTEMLSATLNMGGRPLHLADYVTTGLMAMAVGPRGCGKSNVGLLMAEQLSKQGWVAVLIDPEDELAGLYGEAVKDEEDLRAKLTLREQPILVVNAPDASAFVAYGRVVMEVADSLRKPIFLVIDEGQIYSSPRSRKGDLGEASDLINDLVGRGRKRALDIFVTALGYTGTVHRTLFRNANLKFIGCLEDPTGWAALAPQFRSAGLDFGDLHSLAPGEFFSVSRNGIEKVAMAMAGSLKEVAIQTPDAARLLPKTFTQWDAAMVGIPTPRLRRLTGPVISLLASIAGLTASEIDSGVLALQDELETR